VNSVLSKRMRPSAAAWSDFEVHMTTECLRECSPAKMSHPPELLDGGVCRVFAVEPVELECIMVGDGMGILWWNLLGTWLMLCRVVQSVKRFMIIHGAETFAGIGLEPRSQTLIKASSELAGRDLLGASRGDMFVRASDYSTESSGFREL